MKRIRKAAMLVSNSSPSGPSYGVRGVLSESETSATGATRQACSSAMSADSLTVIFFSASLFKNADRLLELERFTLSVKTSKPLYAASAALTLPSLKVGQVASSRYLSISRVAPDRVRMASYFISAPHRHGHEANRSIREGAYPRPHGAPVVRVVEVRHLVQDAFSRVADVVGIAPLGFPLRAPQPGGTGNANRLVDSAAVAPQQPLAHRGIRPRVIVAIAGDVAGHQPREFLAVCHALKGCNDVQVICRRNIAMARSGALLRRITELFPVNLGADLCRVIADAAASFKDVSRRGDVA